MSGRTLIEIWIEDGKYITINSPLYSSSNIRLTDEGLDYALSELKRVIKEYG